MNGCLVIYIFCCCIFLGGYLWLLLISFSSLSSHLQSILCRSLFIHFIRVGGGGCDLSSGMLCKNHGFRSTALLFIVMNGLLPVCCYWMLLILRRGCRLIFCFRLSFASGLGCRGIDCRCVGVGLKIGSICTLMCLRGGCSIRWGAWGMSVLLDVFIGFATAVFSAFLAGRFGISSMITEGSLQDSLGSYLWHRWSSAQLIWSF